MQCPRVLIFSSPAFMRPVNKKFMAYSFSKILSLILILLFLLPLVSFGGACSNPLNPIKYCNIVEVFTAITNFLLTFGSPIAIIMFLWGGFLYLTSAGDEQKVKMGHMAMTWSAVGLAVIMSGRALVLVICDFLGAVQCV